MQAYVVPGRSMVLASFAAFLIVSFGVFLPVLRSRVCSRGTIRELGICLVYEGAGAEGA